ncbi:MAG: peptidase T [Prevotella sp.]|nr:peptidase T [Candidatus Equicola stercoris]
MNLIERFLKYTTFDTQSNEESSSIPSTPKQLIFANYLKQELDNEGLKEVEIDDKGYIYATLPANTNEDIPTIGFISHYDTSPDCSGKNINARLIKRYNGGDIILSQDKNEKIVTDTSTYPELLKHIGEDIIVTDGHTLLGADDKAGIAEIVQAMSFLQHHDEIKHGKIRIAFNPDEEIGRGAQHFDVKKFNCRWAYTIDGGDLGELEYENFNAASAKIIINGVSVHPGYAKDKMINACMVAMDFASMLPREETPEHTEKYQGFYHLTNFSGNVEKATLSYIIRDHDRQHFEKRKEFILKCTERINSKYGDEIVKIDLSDTYYNMREKVEQQMHVVDIALKAMKDCGISPIVKPIRGGTDGAQLSFNGLICPNLFAGGVNFHGPHEFVSVQVMEKATQLIVNICEQTYKSFIKQN